METYGRMGASVPRYRCTRTPHSPQIDGRLDESEWQSAPRTDLFRDMVTGAPAPLETTGSLLWDERALYIGFRVHEPDLRGELTERDSFIWLENDVELFIGGSDCYYEFEINTLGTVYEAFYVWKNAYTKESRFASDPSFDLIERHVDILGGFQDNFNHPRGPRWAFRDWDFPGLEVKVAIDGTLNDPSDIDRGWSVEIALPWSGMDALTDGKPYTPTVGDIWRVNLFRFETFDFNGRKVEPGAGWAWSTHGVYDSHVPECFGEVELCDDEG